MATKVNDVDAANTTKQPRKKNETLPADDTDTSIFFENTCVNDKPCVAVVDNFMGNIVNIDGKESNGPELPHGKAVVAFIKFPT